MGLRSDQSQLPHWLISILASAATACSAADQLLFHGTIEPFDGRLRASTWEGLRWAAEDPCVAQSYCPETGGLTGWYPPERYRLGEVMLPQGPINQIIFRELGFNADDLAAELDHTGNFLSWRVLPNHPTWQDALAFMVNHGYAITSGICWVKTRRSEMGEVILPADHKDPGRLFILERPADLRIYDHSNKVDGGLTGRQWMHADVFRETAESGEWDAIRIDDIHQSKQLGQFGHSSLGLFEPTLHRLRYHVIDIVHFDPWISWQHRDPNTTPEFEALWASCQPARLAA